MSSLIPRSSDRPTRLAAWLVCLSLLLIAFPAAAQVADGEYGDAPDGVVAGYAAPFVNVVGNFPTAFSTSNSRYSLNGGHTLSISDTWLGQVVSLERGAADPLDPDLVENFIDDDFDDGLVGGFCPVSSAQIFSVYLTFDVTFAAGASGTRYLNVLLDQDHDGTWDNTNGPLEWVAQDFPVSVNPGNTVQVTVGPFAFAQSAVARWMRVAVTSQTIGSVVALNNSGWDGSGQFALGEVEDYRIGNQLEFVVEAEAAAAIAEDHAFSLSASYDRAVARETEIAIECQSASDREVELDIEWQSADAHASAAASAYSYAYSYSQSVVNACANAQAQADAVAGACASCGCASACSSSSASAQASADACAAASASASAFASASAQAAAAAQASADAIAIAYAEASANASACAVAYADAYASAEALAIAVASADASASAAASAVAAAIAASCGGDAVAAAAAAATAVAEAEASATALTASYAHAEASATAYAAAYAYADANADALAVAITQVSAAAAAKASAQATSSVATSTYAAAQATANSLAQANASASAWCSSSCGCCETGTRTATRASLAVTALKAKYGDAYVPAKGSGSFKDVGPEHWASGWVEAAVREGFMSSCGGAAFCPDDAVLRSELTEVVLKAEKGSGYTPTSPKGTFKDLPPVDPRAAWAEEAFSRGLVDGCGGGSFCPTGKATRSELLQATRASFGSPTPACDTAP